MAEPTHGIELSDGDRFAGYRIERRLGRGGMGILYLAVEPGLERHVALKLIAPEAATDEVFSRRFAEESKIAASIEHPNVVPIYAAGEEEGVPFIAMRYVAGADLAKRLVREGRLSPGIAVDLIAQVANGLDAIHAAGLVHRDVKPANVLLSGGDGAEHAYITDFGVARNVVTESGLTQTGRFVGTLDYVAPEQISGGVIDARVDVYALGCLLFKLLTGEVPFPKDGEAARLYAHLNDPPPAPSLYVPEVSMALDDVVVRALSKIPDDRYLSAGDLGRAAQAALKGERPAAPERTVATGAAATRTTETIAADTAVTRASPQPTETPGRATAEAALDAPGKPGGAATGVARNRRLALFAGIAAVLVVIVAVVATAGGGGEGDGANNAASPEKAKANAKNAKSEPEPKPLTKSELIAKADSICESSQSTYRLYGDRFPQGEAEPDPIYSRLLVGISKKAVRGFRRLEPPREARKAFEKYVEAQEEVADLDLDALHAAEAGNASGYLAVREARDVGQPARQYYAEQVGLRVCSGSEL